MIRKVLIVDPDPVSQERCARLLRDCRCEAMLAHSSSLARTHLTKQKFDVALIDFQLASMESFDLPAVARRLHPGIQVSLMIEAHDNIAAHSRLRLREYSLLTKPLKIEELARTLESPPEIAGASPESPSRLEMNEGFAGLIGASEKMKNVFRMVSKVASHRHSVLILGESGTGKELVARAIHSQGPRRDRPFVPIDCGAISSTLIESELFGHVKGSFTGATQSRDGLLAAAGAGTVFLDEIGELPLELQSRLLRALQEHEIRPIGSDQRFKFEARIVAATNQDLEARIKNGTFRQDLYYRLNVVTIKMPALRDRKEDIPDLTRHFLERYDSGHAFLTITEKAASSLVNYAWPGNIRELENCVQRLASLRSGTIVQLKDLPSYVTYCAARKSSLASEIGSLRELERRAICDALKAARGDRIYAAKMLGIGKTTIYRKLKEYGLDSTAPEA